MEGFARVDHLLVLAISFLIFGEVLSLIDGPMQQVLENSTFVL